MIANNYVSLHTHNSYSILDSTSTVEDYIVKLLELKMTAVAFTNHGNISDWIKTKQYLNKAGIKYIHGIEVYVTESHDVKVRDNYHTILLAKNYAGVEEINSLYQDSTDLRHSYFTSRISAEEFCSLSSNVITLSACLGGWFARLPEDNVNYQKMFARLDYVEVQPHSVDAQRELNKKALTCGKPVVACGDFHEVSKYKQECRLKWKGGKGLGYEDEDQFGLVIQSYDEFRAEFIKQGTLTEKQIDDAIEMTNTINESIEDFELDTSFKFPTLYEDAVNLLRTKTYSALEKMIDENYALVIQKYDVYVARIETELEAFRVLKMESFILFIGEMLTWARSEGIHIGPARGSASGSLVCYLVGVTEVDPILWGTNFTRFININRISLPDIDVDIVPRERPRVFEYIKDRFGVEYSGHIATFTKLGIKSVIQDIGRALHMPPYEVDAIKKGYAVIDAEHQRLIKQHVDGLVGDEEFEVMEAEMTTKSEEYLSQFSNIFYYYEGLKGAISATGIHPAGFIGSPIDVKKSIGMRYNKDIGRYVSSNSMKPVDSLNYVKYDCLSLNTLQIIADCYNMVGKPIPSASELDWYDIAVIESVKDSPIGLFQFEKESSWHHLKAFDCKSVADMALVSAVIRPSCASFLERIIKREHNINASADIDELLSDSLGYLVYQEQQIKFLQVKCGFTEGEADVIRRAIGKKSKEEMDKWLPLIKAGYIRVSDKSEEEAMAEVEQFMIIFLDAVNYSLNEANINHL